MSPYNIKTRYQICRLNQKIQKLRACPERDDLIKQREALELIADKS